MKKRRLIALLLCFCMTAGTFTPVLAENGEDAVIVAEESTYKIIYNSTNSTRRSSVASYSGFCSGTAEIFAFVDGCTVTEIESGAFSGCQWESVYIPASITNIADDAFDKDSEIIIKCSPYSMAYQYAVENNMAYELTVSETDATVYMSDISASDSDRYTGNQGDSYIAPYNKDTTITGISSTNYTDGLGAWIARWNFKDEKSWAWNEYDIDGDFKKLTGYIDVGVTTYNTISYDTTIQFIGDDVILAEYSLNSSTQYPVNIDTDVSGVDVLKINVFDNTETSGGTEFILGDIALHREDNADNEAKPDYSVHEFNGNQYAVIDESMTWTEAKAYCENLGGHLATITSEEEQAFIESIMEDATGYEAYWIGGYKDTSWEWVTNETFIYTNWAPGEPNHDDAEYLQIYSPTNGYDIFRWDNTWNDGDHAGNGIKEEGLICEWGDNTSIPTSITTTFDTTEILLEEGAIFNFNGLVSTTAETGLNDLQINIANAETGVGIKYHREDDIGTSEFDLSAVPPFVTGTTLTGEDQQGYKHTLELTAGTSWYVQLFATDNAGNNIGEDVIKKITITENPGEFLIGKTFNQTTNVSGQDMSQGIPSLVFGENHTGTFNWFDSAIGAISDVFFYSVVADEITLVPVSTDWFVGLAKEVTLQIVNNDHLLVSSIVCNDGNDTFLTSCTVVGDEFVVELPQVAPAVTGLKDNYTVTQGESLTVTFTVTAEDEANLKAVTVQNSVTGENCYRQVDISVNAHTVNCTIPVNELDVGTHKFIVYASADNYTVTDNNVAMFTVTVKEKEVVIDEWELSENGVAFIMDCEGSYRDKYGNHLIYDDLGKYNTWEKATIGYGTLIDTDEEALLISDGVYTLAELRKLKFEYGMFTITHEEALNLVRQEFADVVNSVNKFIKKYNISVTQNQFDVLVSLTYNSSYGPTSNCRIHKVLTGQKGLNGEEIDAKTIKEAFATWCLEPVTKADVENLEKDEWFINEKGTYYIYVRGLVKRRLAEAYIFMNGFTKGTGVENYYKPYDNEVTYYLDVKKGIEANPSIYVKKSVIEDAPESGDDLTQTKELLHWPIEKGLTFQNTSLSEGCYHDIPTAGQLKELYAIADGTITLKQVYYLNEKDEKILFSYGKYIEFTSANNKYYAKYCHLDSFLNVYQNEISSSSSNAIGEDDLASLKKQKIKDGIISSDDVVHYKKTKETIATISVKRGDFIGMAGNTGNVRGNTQPYPGAHLHFELYETANNIQKRICPKKFENWDASTQ